MGLSGFMNYSVVNVFFDVKMVVLYVFVNNEVGRCCCYKIKVEECNF